MEQNKQQHFQTVDSTNRSGQKYKNGPRRNPRSNSKPRNNKNVEQQSSDMGISTIIGNDMLKKLECPVCMDPMVGNILLCETGHSICQECSVKLSPAICPICRSKITLQRNFTLEDMARSMVISCGNAHFGCKYMTFPKNMQYHIDKCSFKQIFCPLGKISNKCTWNGKKNNLREHINQCHADNMKYSFGHEIKITLPFKQPFEDIQIMSNNDSFFIFHLSVNLHWKVVYFALQYMGEEFTAFKWKYTLHVYKKSDPMKKIDISEMCLSDTMNMNNMYKNGHCIGLPSHVLRNYVQPDQSLTFKLFAHFQKNVETNPK